MERWRFSDGLHGPIGSTIGLRAERELTQVTRVDDA
jgi:hypothetical protein